MIKVGSVWWKTFDFKSMKNSKSSTVKPTTTTDDTTRPVIKREYKIESKVNHKQSEQSKSPILKTLKSINKHHGSFRESVKGGGGGGRVGVGKSIIHNGNNQIVGSKNIIPPSTPKPPPPSSSSSTCNNNTFTMVTNLKRAASVPLMINTQSRSNLNNVKQLGNNNLVPDSVPVNQLNNFETMFQYFDSNGNGYISEDELIEMMGSLGEPISRVEAKLMIKEADVNCDGKIDYQEFRNLLNRLPLIFSSPSSMSLRDAFNIFDQDSDGYVNMEEVKLIATAIGIELNEKSIDYIQNQLKQSTASSISKPNNQSNNVKINLDQLKKFFDSIGKK